MKHSFLFIFLTYTTIAFSQNKELYIKENLSLLKNRDSLIFNYHSVYDRPDMVDEEYHKKISFILLKKDLLIGKNIPIGNYSIPIGVVIFGNWGQSEVQKLWGNIKILEMDNKYIKLSIKLTGVWGKQTKRRELINKILIFER